MPFQARQIDPAGSAFARLGAQLRALREAAGLSQAALSKKVNYSPDLIRRVEATERFPTHEFLVACDRALAADGALLALWPAAQQERTDAGTATETVGRQRSVRFDPVKSARIIEQWSQADFAVPAASPPAAGQRLWATSEDVAVAHSTLRMFRDLDHAHGAGAFAAHLRSYIDSELSAILARPAVNQTVAVERGRIATGFFELAGYQAVDSGRPGWAQSYYAQAIEVATQIGDRGYGAYLVSANLAHLALHCGQPTTALNWACRAIDHAGTSTSPATRSAITAVAARAYARLGDEKATTGMLAEAERLLDASTPTDEPAWIAYFNRAYLSDEMAHAFHDLGRPPAARREATDALDGVGQTHVRRLAIDAALLASTWLRSGDVEQACAIGRDAVTYAARTSSGRCVQRVAQLSIDIGAFESVRAVEEFDQFVHEVLPAAARPPVIVRGR